MRGKTVDLRALQVHALETGTPHFAREQAVLSPPDAPLLSMTYAIPLGRTLHFEHSNYYWDIVIVYAVRFVLRNCLGGRGLEA